MAVQDEEFFAAILHDVAAEVIDEKSNIRRVASVRLCWHGNGESSLVFKEHFEATSGAGSVSVDCGRNREGDTVIAVLSE